MRNKKIMSLFVMVMMMSFAFPVMAQENLNVLVPAGDTIESSMTAEVLDEGASSVLGGLISNIVNTETIRRWVKFAGQDVWFKEDTTVAPVMDFELYAFGAGTADGFLSLSIIDLFETSENVDINGVNAVWETMNAEALVSEEVIEIVPAGADVQAIKGFNNEMFVGSLNIEFKDPSNYKLATYKEISNPEPDIDPDSLSFKICDANCPTEAELEAIYGGDITDMEYISMEFTWCYLLGHTTETGYVMTFLRDGARGYLADINSDKVWDLAPVSQIITPEVRAFGYSVTANQGQTLGIIPAGNYDIFAIMP